MNLATRLQQLRTRQGLTQTQLASKLEIPRSLFANYEQGRRQPLLDTLVRIADFFEVSLDFLAGREEYTVSSFMSKIPSDPNTEMLVEISQKFDEERRIFEVPRFDLEHDNVVVSETRLTYLADKVDYSPAYYIDTRGFVVSQLDMFNDALLFVQDCPDENATEPTYVIMRLPDGSIHVAIQQEFNTTHFLSTYDWKMRPFADGIVDAFFKIIKVEHDLL